MAAITGLFGEYASDAENSGSEGQERTPDNGAVPLLTAEDRAGPDPALALSIPSTAVESPQPDAAEQRALDSVTPPESIVHSPSLHNASDLPADLIQAPPGLVDPEVKKRLDRLLSAKQRQGATLAEIMTKHQGARNPDFLRKMVEHFDIQEYGSHFTKDKFDLQAAPKEDFYDRLAAQQAEAERKREEMRKQSGRVDFVSAGRSTPPNSTAGAMSAASIAAQAKVTAGGKRGSKWDTAPKR